MPHPRPHLCGSGRQPVAMRRSASPLGALAPLWLVWAESIDDKEFVWSRPHFSICRCGRRIPRPRRGLIVFGLTFFILRSIIGGFGDPEKRRKVGMLWDAGSFWPRWFHPLAPPLVLALPVKKSEGGASSRKGARSSPLTHRARSSPASPCPSRTPAPPCPAHVRLPAGTAL